MMGEENYMVEAYAVDKNIEIIPARDNISYVVLTFTLQTLSHQAPEHLTTEVTKMRRLV